MPIEMKYGPAAGAVGMAAYTAGIGRGQQQAAHAWLPVVEQQRATDAHAAMEQNRFKERQQLVEQQFDQRHQLQEDQQQAVQARDIEKGLMKGEFDFPDVKSRSSWQALQVERSRVTTDPNLSPVARQIALRQNAEKRQALMGLAQPIDPLEKTRRDIEHAQLLTENGYQNSPHGPIPIPQPKETKAAKPTIDYGKLSNDIQAKLERDEKAYRDESTPATKDAPATLKHSEQQVQDYLKEREQYHIQAQVDAHARIDRLKQALEPQGQQDAGPGDFSGDDGGGGSIDEDSALPQSDADTAIDSISASHQQEAALPNIPRTAAGQQAGIPMIHSQAEFDVLASKTVFINAKTGKKVVKP